MGDRPPPHLLAVDPGKRHAGVAYFRGGLLHSAGTVRVRSHRGLDLVHAILKWRRDRVREPATWVIEDQQDYPGKGGRARDLASLRRQAGRLIRVAEGRGMVRRLVRPSPAEWKGQVPKEVHHRRLAPHLTGGEWVVWLGTSGDLDARDAIGLGLWSLGRTGRGGIGDR